MISPFWSLANEFLAGVSAASGIALVTSIRSLGGFVGPFVIGAVAKGAAGSTEVSPSLAYHCLYQRRL
jgi:ACS family tartrate transporter-like MFS transporter